MFLEFKTKRNTYGHYNYLCIDTVNSLYSRVNNHMTAPCAIEIKSSDYRYLLDNLNTAGFTQVSHGIN